MSQVNKHLFMVRVAEVSNFCLAHTGKCFNAWPKETVFLYVGFAALTGCLFVKRDKGVVKAVGFAFPAVMADLEKPFDWHLPPQADCLLIREVIGDKNDCKDFAKLASRQWPRFRRFFTFRSRGFELRLVEIKAEVMRRFYNWEMREAQI